VKAARGFKSLFLRQTRMNAKFMRVVFLPENNLAGKNQTRMSTEKSVFMRVLCFDYEIAFQDKSL
jgi:hypothetical protein